MSILIFANGVMVDVEWTRPFFDHASLVIAADGGSRHLHRLQRQPDLVIGDMDSVPADVLAWLEAGDATLIRHDPMKDETDLELALLQAQQVAGVDDEILLFGTLGGRMDHMLANVLLLASPALAESRIQLVEGQERAWLIRDHCQFAAQPGDVVSLLPIGGDVLVRQRRACAGLCMTVCWCFGQARGVSNEATAVPFP
ncbi:MAG: thiamine diphosphokinase [Chloroflexi bacterium]|nr:thiamine diphosphokinase [Chloroflexota bacterium]